MNTYENNPLLSINDVSLSIDGKSIIKNVSADMFRGEFIGLVGPNGAGKTTLMKALNGINKIDSGNVVISRRNIKEMSDKDIAKRISFMSQNTFLSYELTSENVVLMGRYPHMGRFEKETLKDYNIVKKYMAYTDTVKLSEKFVTEVSGGERQRILFAKALAQETEILLLDEPTASLDITHQEQIFRYGDELAKAGKLVVAAVHDLRIAAKYCSRLILINNGEILSDGKPEEVLTKENMKVAYGINALVYKNKLSGMLDFYVHEGNEETGKGKIHVVGGGGSGSGIMRLLFKKGYEVSAGVFMPGDSDFEIARLLGFKCSVSKPFCTIDDEAYKRNIEMVEKADFVVLCNMPFGEQNIRNLLACMYAKKLIIIEDENPATRDYTGGKGIEVYDSIKRSAVVTNSVMIHEMV